MLVVFLVCSGCEFVYVGVSRSCNGAGVRVAVWGDGEAMGAGVEVK
jgi:hypothetical protein